MAAFRALKPLLRSERGSVPASLLIMVAITLLAAAVVTASNIALSGSSRDHAQKRALAAADAGVAKALYRENNILATDALPCLIGGVGGGLVPGVPLVDGWCPTVTEEVSGATYRYRVKPPVQVFDLQNLFKTRVVAVGEYNGQRRRIMVTASSPVGSNIFNGHAVQSLHDLTLDGNGVIEGSGASNRNVVLDGSAQICGDVQHGIAHGLIRNGNASQCSGFSLTGGPLFLAPPDQGNAASVNDNGRFFGQDPKNGSVSWDPTSRALTLTGNSTLTMGGQIYSLCQLRMSGNSTLVIAADAGVKIFFDSPESCGLGSGSEQISLTGNSRITNTSQRPSAAQFLMVGSSERKSVAKLAGNGSVQHDLILYAPRSEIQISGYGTYNGAIAGSDVQISGNGKVTYSGDVDNLEINVLPVYRRDRYIECRGGAFPSGGAPPDRDC